MAQTFTIRKNPGDAIRTFTASNFEEFKDKLGTDWTCGSEDGLGFFFDSRFQVKARIGQSRLVCR